MTCSSTRRDPEGLPLRWLRIEQTTQGVAPKLERATTRHARRDAHPAFARKPHRLREHTTSCGSNSPARRGLFRASTRAPYRWERRCRHRSKGLRRGGGFNSPAIFVVYIPEEQGFFSHNDGSSSRSRTRSCPAQPREHPRRGRRRGVKIALYDAEVESTPILWFPRHQQQAASPHVSGISPRGAALHRSRPARHPDRRLLAKTRGTRAYRGRVLGVARQDADLLTQFARLPPPGASRVRTPRGSRRQGRLGL